MHIGITLPPVTNSEDWYETFDVTDEDTGGAFNFTGWTLTLTVSYPRHSRRGAIAFSVSDTTGEITFPAGRTSGQFVVNVPNSSLSTLDPETYPVGIVMENGDGEKFQIVLGVLPIVDGVV